ncbi:hypothetical protein BC936DRAFT_149021 [Jimgerdemannia flammicorona]|uniref:Uncharacterized protein n=1 Tax=Jimgerdemannia flammicorona TaxID=994334 RepID=A0A433D1S3_9FUNG|nr:hypothetical protein BC936DRAFT_149021 [Jimgerdemannia flammicorona]
MGFWDFGTLGFWDLGFWDFGTLGFWDFGILGFWDFDFGIRNLGNKVICRCLLSSRIQLEFYLLYHHTPSLLCNILGIKMKSRNHRIHLHRTIAKLSLAVPSCQHINTDHPREWINKKVGPYQNSGNKDRQLIPQNPNVD